MKHSNQPTTKVYRSSNQRFPSSSLLYSKMHLQMPSSITQQYSDSWKTKGSQQWNRNYGSRNNSPQSNKQTSQHTNSRIKDMQFYELIQNKESLNATQANNVTKFANNFVYTPQDLASIRSSGLNPTVDTYPVSLQNSVPVSDHSSKRQVEAIRIGGYNPKINQPMINKHFEQTVIISRNIERSLFRYKYIIGKGGFGKVWKVEYVCNRQCYAMKEMLKSIVLSRKSLRSILSEQKILAKLRSSFLVNINYAFQDRETLYLVLDLMQGGDLRHHLGHHIFNECQIKFFICCLIIGLEYIHSNGIIHRDVKPENLVFDQWGYLRITDFGIARQFRLDNYSDTSGTPGYMSPEVICRQNHTNVSDFFAVGVIAYELMLGKRPYNGSSRVQIRQQILSKQASIKPQQLPEHWDFNALDFTNRLLQRKPEHRLGFRTIEQIKSHPWLADVNWGKLSRKQVQSPFIPLMHKTDFEQNLQITVEDEGEAELIEKNSLLLRRQELQDLFKEYYYSAADTDFQQTKATSKMQSNQRKQRNVRPEHDLRGTQTAKARERPTNFTYQHKVQTPSTNKLYDYPLYGNHGNVSVRSSQNSNLIAPNYIQKTACKIHNVTYSSPINSVQTNNTVMSKKSLASDHKAQESSPDNFYQYKH